MDDNLQQLALGNIKKHNELIIEAVKREIEKSDVVVLAQASMAAALSDCEGLDMSKILTSPLRGILKLKKTVENI